MFTQKITRSKGLILLLLLVILAVSGVPDVLAAAGAGVSGAPPGGSVSATVNAINSALSLANTFMHILLLIILNMLGYLLQADFLNDPTMMSALNNIWQLSRNIMNVIFALMLIGVAIYTIFTANSEVIKSKMSNFIFAVILVNFSWFFPRVIIDVANVLTATVYSIPNTFSFSCIDFHGEPCRVITNIKILPNIGEIDGWKTEAGCTGFGGDAECACPSNLTCYATRAYSSASGNMGAAHAMIDGMATSFIRFQAMTQIPPDINLDADNTTVTVFITTIKVTINVIMAFFVQISIILPLLGLGVGLFIRIIILWVTTAFMPFTFLGFVINGKLGTNIFGFETDIWQEFINAAFLPAVVGIPFVIGFIMLSTVSQIGVPDAFPQSWGFPLLKGFDNWWEMMWMFAAVGIIWIGSFAALARSKITGRVTERIKGFGETVFRAGLQLPLIVPLPVGPNFNTAGKLNVGSIINGPRNLSNAINAKALGLDRNRQGGGGGIDERRVEGLGGLESESTQRIVNALETLAREKTSGSGGERSKAISDINLAIGGQGQSASQTLEQLERIVSRGKAPQALRDKIDQIRKAIEEERKAPPRS